MTRFKSVNAFTALLVLVVAGVFLFTGCSQSPTSSKATDYTPQLLQRVDLGGAAKVINLFVTDTISARDGGSLQLLDVILEVPAGAVDNDTLFSIFIPDDEVFYNEFGTDGLVFNKPVTVTMSYRDADLTNVDESTIRIAFYDEATGRWEDQSCSLDRANKLVTASLRHFSAYGLISD